jgi:hypothetical protein
MRRRNGWNCDARFHFSHHVLHDLVYVCCVEGHWILYLDQDKHSRWSRSVTLRFFFTSGCSSRNPLDREPYRRILSADSLLYVLRVTRKKHMIALASTQWVNGQLRKLIRFIVDIQRLQHNQLPSCHGWMLHRCGCIAYDSSGLHHCPFTVPRRSADGNSGRRSDRSTVHQIILRSSPPSRIVAGE